MRKTSTYSTKRRQITGDYYNGAAWLAVVQRCQPYTAEPVLGGLAQATQSAADKSMILMRDAFVTIKAGQANPHDSREFDLLAHAMGVTYLRACDIAGTDEFDNPMLPIWRAGNEALRRCKDRYTKLGRWGFDGPALDELDAAIELYETILQSSSPAQMDETSVRRIEILAAQSKGGTMLDLGGKPESRTTEGQR